MEETELTEHGIMCILDYYVQNMPDFPISFFLRCRRSWRESWVDNKVDGEAKERIMTYFSEHFRNTCFLEV